MEMEKTIKFKFYPHDFVLGYWPHIFVYHFAPGFIDVWDYISGYIGGSFIDRWDYIVGYISGFIGTGDEAHYIVESGPVWS